MQWNGLLEQLVKIGVESRVFTDDSLHYLALWVYDNLCREALDAVVLHDVCALRVIDMLPWEVKLFDGRLPFFLGVTAVHAENLKLAGILLVIVLHLRHALYAPAAPCSPEVKDNILATEGTQRQWFSVNVVQRKVRGEGGIVSLRLGSFWLA